MHANSVRAGFLDLDGCSVVDMLPRWEYLDIACFLCLLYLYSNFIPTCSECSTVYPAPGVVSVRGESTMTICRECHRKMSMSSCFQSASEGVIEYHIDMRHFRLGFKIPEVKFLQVSAAVGTYTRLHAFWITFHPFHHLQFEAVMDGPAGYFPLISERWQCEQTVLLLEKR